MWISVNSTLDLNFLLPTSTLLNGTKLGVNSSTNPGVNTDSHTDGAIMGISSPLKIEHPRESRPHSPITPANEDTSACLKSYLLQHALRHSAYRRRRSYPPEFLRSIHAHACSRLPKSLSWNQLLNSTVIDYFYRKMTFCESIDVVDYIYQEQLSRAP